MNTKNNDTDETEAEYLPMPLICCTRSWARHTDREPMDGYSQALLVIIMVLIVSEIILSAAA